MSARCPATARRSSSTRSAIAELGPALRAHAARCSMATGSAFARAALAGNPSDGYGGAVLAVCVPGLAAHAEAQPAARTRSDPPSALVDAAVARYGRGPCAVRWSTTVPREVGLGGSSAIVTAVVRALCALHGDVLAPASWPSWCSRSRSRTSASPPDRRTATPRPTRGSCSWTSPVSARTSNAWTPRYCRTSIWPGTRMRPRPRMRSTAACASGRTIPGCAPDGAARRTRAHGGRRAAQRRSGRLRQGRGRLVRRARGAPGPRPRARAMVRAARATGASANYAGSGGAIVGTLPSAGLGPVAHALRALGCEIIAPSLAL